MNGVKTEQLELCKSADERLGRHEVSQLLKAIGIKATPQELKEIFNDVAGDEAKIDFNGFVVLMTRKYKQLPIDEEIKSTFKSMDVNNNSFIDVQDIISLMKSNGHEITQEDAQEMLSLISDSPQGITQQGLISFIQTKM